MVYKELLLLFSFLLVPGLGPTSANATASTIKWGKDNFGSIRRNSTKGSQFDGRNPHRNIIAPISGELSSATVPLLDPDPDFAHELVLSPDVKLSWEGYIDFNMILFTVETTLVDRGYVAFGFSRSGYKAGSDGVILTMDPDGTFLYDVNFENLNLPFPDSQQDWIIWSTYTTDGSKFTISREFDTKDADDEPFEDRDIYLLWAFHPTSTDIEEHTKENRGAIPFNIFTGVWTPDFQDAVELSPNLKVVWRGFVSSDRMVFEVHTDLINRGYFSFGFSLSGNKANSDSVMCVMRASGGCEPQDSYFDGFSNPPIKDTTEDWSLDQIISNDEGSIVTLSRCFDTGDVSDYQFKDEDIFLIWAYHPTATGHNVHTRENRGSVPINLFGRSTTTETTFPTETTPTPSDSTATECPTTSLPQTTDANSYIFNRTVIIPDALTIHWSVNLRSEYILFDVTARTTGYVGLGISDFGSMEEADIFIGGHILGTSYFGDYHSLRNGELLMDAVGNWDLIREASEENGYTSLSFGRRLNTRDTNHDNVIKNDWTYFIWALGDSDELVYHGFKRGSYRVNILDPNPEEGVCI